MARQLFTSEGAPCLKCHMDGDAKHDVHATAPNFTVARERLKPGWTRRWMLNPAMMSPGTAMPSGLFRQEDNRWVLAGIYSRDLDKRVVVRYLAKRGELLLKAGDALPSGEKIVEIGADSVWVKAGTKKRKLPLYSVELIDAVKTAAGADSNPVSANEANPPSPPRRHHP